MKPGKALAIVLALGIGAAVLPQLCAQTQTGGTFLLPAGRADLVQIHGDSRLGRLRGSALISFARNQQLGQNERPFLRPEDRTPSRLRIRL